MRTGPYMCVLVGLGDASAEPPARLCTAVRVWCVCGTCAVRVRCTHSVQCMHSVQRMQRCNTGPAGRCVLQTRCSSCLPGTDPYPRRTPWLSTPTPGPRPTSKSRPLLTSSSQLLTGSRAPAAGCACGVSVRRARVVSQARSTSRTGLSRKKIGMSAELFRASSSFIFGGVFALPRAISRNLLRTRCDKAPGLSCLNNVSAAISRARKQDLAFVVCAFLASRGPLFFFLVQIPRSTRAGSPELGRSQGEGCGEAGARFIAGSERAGPIHDSYTRVEAIN